MNTEFICLQLLWIIGTDIKQATNLQIKDKAPFFSPKSVKK